MHNIMQRQVWARAIAKGRWAETAEGHGGFHWCQPRTEGSGDGLTKTGHLKAGKM